MPTFTGKSMSLQRELRIVLILCQLGGCEIYSLDCDGKCRHASRKVCAGDQVAVA